MYIDGQHLLGRSPSDSLKHLRRGGATSTWLYLHESDQGETDIQTCHWGEGHIHMVVTSRVAET